MVDALNEDGSEDPESDPPTDDDPDAEKSAQVEPACVHLSDSPMIELRPQHAESADHEE